MAAAQAGKLAGWPRCRPSVNGTPSNQKNGPTPADCTQPSTAAVRSGTTQQTCMNSRLGKVRAAMSAISADHREPAIAERLPWLHGRVIEVGTRRPVPADVGGLGDHDVGPPWPADRVLPRAMDRQV